MKGAEAVQSTFLVELEKLLDAALQVPEIQGIILNPWNRTISWTRPCSGSSRDKHERARLPHFGARRRALFILVKEEGEWQIRQRRCGFS